MEKKQVFLQFEVEQDADRYAIAKLIEEQLNSLDIVDEVEATPDETQLTGVEIVAGIAVGVTIVHAGRELTKEIRELVEEITKLIQAVKGLKEVLVEIGDEKVPINQLDEEKLKMIAEEN